MRRLPVLMIVVLLLLAALLFVLSNQAREVPVQTIETQVGRGGNAS